MSKLKQIVDAANRMHHEFGEACFAGLHRSEYERYLSSRKAKEPRRDAEDPTLRKIKSDLIAEINDKYLRKPYVRGIPREIFKGNWIEYTGFKCGEWIDMIRENNP